MNSSEDAMVIAISNAEHQQQLIVEALKNCLRKMNESSPSKAQNGGEKCGMAWDNILCWNEAPAGHLAKQHCPNYISRFNTEHYVTRYCTENGTWYVSPLTNKTWSNFTDCTRQSDEYHDLAADGERLRLLYTTGYGISLGSLVIAVCIMLCCRRLSSKSNILHVNLFLAFILRASLSFLKEALFVKHVGFHKDIRWLEDGRIEFIHEGTHWECRLLASVFMYSICASQMWIFMEGLYLHNLIYHTLHTERRGVRFYIILGWLLPLTFLIPWVVVKAVLDNHYCWTIGAKKEYFWIIHGPLLATVLINFIFFLDILRVLCSRIRATSRHMGGAKYRRLAKFVLVLIPLFGVMYTAFHVAFPARFKGARDVTHLYMEMTYNSLQGFILALLFCFLNEEVHAEIKRIWNRHKSRRGDSIALTRSFGISSLKRSVRTNGRVLSKTNDVGRSEDFLKKLKTRAFKIFTKTDTISDENSDMKSFEDEEKLTKDKNDNQQPEAV